MGDPTFPCPTCGVVVESLWSGHTCGGGLPSLRLDLDPVPLSDDVRETLRFYLSINATRPPAGGVGPARVAVDALLEDLAHHGILVVSAREGTARLIADQLTDMDGLDRSDRYVQMMRVAKLTEEVGEAAEAIIAYHDVNPRKEAGTLDDVIKELADVALTAKVGIENFGRDADEAVADREREVLERLRAKAADRESIKPGSAPEEGARHG